MKPTHLFVGSCPRAGTSALTQILNAHPECIVGMERYISIWPENLLTPKHFTPEVFLAEHEFDKGRSLARQFATNDFSARFPTARYVGDKFPFVTDHLP